MTRKMISLFFCLTLLFGMQASTLAASQQSGPGDNNDRSLPSPEAPASFSIDNPYQGSFTTPNLGLSFTVRATNHGVQDDTYDLSNNSTWSLRYYDTRGIPLTDTNSNGQIDTGVVHPGETVEIIVRVQTPTIVNPGDYNYFEVRLTSALDPAESQVASLQTAVPVPFAQIYRTVNIDEFGNSHLLLLRPDEQRYTLLANNERWAYDAAIAETRSDSFVTVSSVGDLIYYLLVDHQGEQIRPSTRLSVPAGGGLYTYDDNPTVAVAPDGSIGITWGRRLDNTGPGFNYNIYFAILDPAGNLRLGPLNLTNNQGWGFLTCEVNFERFPVIAATTDNRFVIAWEHCGKQSGNEVWDIGTSIYSTAGAQIQAPTGLLNNQPGSGHVYGMPSISALSDSRVLITFLKDGYPIYSQMDQWYTVCNSSGSIVRQPVNLSNDGNNGTETVETGWADSLQLSNGNIVVAWGLAEDARYAVLDEDFTQIVGPTSMSPPTPGRGEGLSLSADPSGHAVFTEKSNDYDNQYLFYALINPDGSLHSSLMIFKANMYPYVIETGHSAFYNTTYTIAPTITTADLFIQAPTDNPAGPDRHASLPIRFGNMGSATASDVVITATLSSGLSYVGDSSGVTPTLQTDDLTWSFPGSMSFLGAGKFDLRLSAPQAEIGSSLPVTLTVHTAQPDGDLSNNSFVAQISIPTTPYMYFPIIVH